MKPLGNSMNATQILFGNYTGRNGLVNTFLDKMSETFNLNLSYFQVTKTLNGIDYPNQLYDVWIMDEKSYKEPTSKKKIIMKPEQDLNRGDIINWNNQKWLVTSIDEQVFPYNEGVLEYCNDSLRCILPDGRLINEPCVLTQVSKRSMSLTTIGSVLEVPKMAFFCACQNNDNTIGIPFSYRFMLGARVPYRLIDADDISQKGTINFQLESNQKRPTDNVNGNGLADNSTLLAVIPTGALIIEGSAKISTGTSQPYQIIYDNGSPVTGMTFIFTVSSTNAVITVVDGLNINILGKVSSQFKLTGVCGNITLTKVISIANSF